MAEFDFHDIFPETEDKTPYRKLTSDHVTKASFDSTHIDALVAKFQGANEQKIPVQRATEVVEVVGKKFSWTDVERKGIFARLIENGDVSRYGLHSATTRYSADVESYDAATKLERDGGRIIELQPKEFEAVLKEAA